MVLGDVGDEPVLADRQKKPETPVQNGAGRAVPVHELHLIVHGPVGDPSGEQTEQDVVEALVHHFDAGAKRFFADRRSGERQFGLFQIERVLDVVGTMLEHCIHVA